MAKDADVARLGGMTDAPPRLRSVLGSLPAYSWAGIPGLIPGQVES